MKKSYIKIVCRNPKKNFVCSDEKIVFNDEKIVCSKIVCRELSKSYIENYKISKSYIENYNRSKSYIENFEISKSYVGKCRNRM